MTASTRSSPSSASPCSSTDLSKPTCAPPSAPTPHCPACCPSTATRSPPPAPCWPPSPTYTPPTPAAGSPSTGSPPSNDSSSPTSTSPYHGPKHSVPQQHPKPQTLTPNYAENGSSEPTSGVGVAGCAHGGENTGAASQVHVEALPLYKSRNTSSAPGSCSRYPCRQSGGTAGDVPPAAALGAGPQAPHWAELEALVLRLWW